MAGMGFVGAGGAAGTYEGLADWMRGRRQKVVQGQRDEDRLREQALQDQALAAEAAAREYDMARQRVIDERAGTTFQNQQTEFGWETADRAKALTQEQKVLAAREQLKAGIDALDDPRATPFRKQLAKYDIDQKGRPSEEFEELLKEREKKLQFAPSGQLLDVNDPKNLGGNFAAPVRPAQSADDIIPVKSFKDGKETITYMRESQAAKQGPFEQAPDKADTPDVPAAMKMRLSQASEAQKVLTQLKSVFDGNEKTVGAKAFIGPDEGRFNSVRQSLPKWAGGKVNPTFAEFKVASARLKNSIVQAITGAAVGVDEAKRIMDEIPTENDPPELWEVKWRQSMVNVENIRNGIYETTGYTPPAMAPSQTQGVRLTPGAAAGPGRRVRYDAAGNRVP